MSLDSPHATSGRAPAHDELNAALALAREQLDMELALLGEVVDDREIARFVVGEAEGFGAYEGASAALSETYCQRLLTGRIEGIVRDTALDPETAALPVTRRARIGAYVGVPIEARDARLYVLCCLAHEARPALGEADLRFMRGIAETVRAALDR